MKQFTIVSAVVALALLLCAATVIADDQSEWVIPHQYFVSWKQGDYPNDIMTTKSIAQVGCLVCSVAVGLRNRGITLPDGSLVDPSTFNKFIKDNDGYDNDNFIHGTVDKICEGRENCKTFFNGEDAIHRKQDFTMDQVKEILTKGERHLVANVNSSSGTVGGHFVAIVGFHNKLERVKAIDSAGGIGTREWYDLSEIVGWRLYDFKGPFDKMFNKSQQQKPQQPQQPKNDIEQFARSIGL